MILCHAFYSFNYYFLDLKDEVFALLGGVWLNFRPCVCFVVDLQKVNKQ